MTICDHTRDHCDICQSETFSEGVFKMGKLWCRECFSGRTAPVAMPPTAAQRLQLDMWLKPKMPIKRQTPHHGELANYGEVLHG